MLGLLNPWALLAALICSLGMVAGGYEWGSRSATNACEAKKGAAQTKVIERHEQVAEVAQSVAVASAERHVQVVTKFQTIDREVIRYVQTPAATTPCLDDDGLRIWTAANHGTFEPATAERAGHVALLGASSAGVGGGWGSAGESRHPGETVLRVPGEASGPGRASAQDSVGEQ